MKFFNKYKLAIIGVIIGALAGFLYWKYVGCSSGSCPITSSPLNMTLFGAVMGGLLFDILFYKKK